MTDMAAATAAVLALICDSPAVVHVDYGLRFTDEVVVVLIRGNEDRDEVQRLLDDAPYLTHINTIFSPGDFTKDTLRTKWSWFVRGLPNTHIHGTLMQRWSSRLMHDLERRENEAWLAMDEEAQTQAIADKIAHQRSRGQIDFGNCWSGPVSELTAEAQAMVAGLEATTEAVLSASCELPGVINVSTNFRRDRTFELAYFSLVTVTPSADEDAVIRRLAAITGGDIQIMRFFYPTLSAAIDKAMEAPVIEYNVPDTRFGEIDREDLARQDAALWESMGEMRQSDAIEAEIARRHAAGDVSFKANCW